MEVESCTDSVLGKNSIRFTLRQALHRVTWRCKLCASLFQEACRKIFRTLRGRRRPHRKDENMGQESACFCGLNSSVRCQALLRSGLCGRGKIAPEEDGDWSESHQAPVSARPAISGLGEFKF